MIKCLYTDNKDGKPPRCDKPVEYIYLGKSYCSEHLEIRSEEMRQERIKTDLLLKPLTDLTKKI